MLALGMPTDLAQVGVADFLDDLAARTSAPAGGVAAAFLAAQAAALVAMAGRFSAKNDVTSTNAAGDRTADQADDQVADHVVLEADRLRARALALAGEDMKAFALVRTAWALPPGQDKDQRVREVLAAAAGPPAAVLAVAETIVGLAERLLPVVSPSVAADLAAGVDAAHAAASTSRRNVEANLVGDGGAHPLRAEIADVDQLLARAVELGETVRRRVGA